MGKHSTSNTRTISRLAATAAATVAIPGMVAVGTAGEAEAAANWDPIIQCESGGDPKAQNAVSTASGLFQFIDGTWKAYGGSTSKAKHASVAEQYAVANRAYAAEGYRPWNASKGCWGPKMSGGGSSTPVKVVEAPVKQEAPKQAEKTQKVEAKPTPKAEPTKTSSVEKTAKIEKPKAAPVKVTPAPVVPAGASYTPDGDGLYTVQLGDTLTSLAKDNGTTVQALMDLNKDIIEMPDWIFAGERIHLK